MADLIGMGGRLVYEICETYFFVIWLCYRDTDIEDRGVYYLRPFTS